MYVLIFNRPVIVWGTSSSGALLGRVQVLFDNIGRYKAARDSSDNASSFHFSIEPTPRVIRAAIDRDMCDAIISKFQFDR